MRILVLSDSHNVILDSQIEEMKREGKYDLLIHCGDKYKDAEIFAEKLDTKKVLRVPGNCDYSIMDTENILIKEIEGIKFVITHGHLHNVKLNLNKLINFANKNKADVVLYGHTHQSANEIIDSILYFNPGSPILPKDGKASFGVIEISEGKIQSKVVYVEN